MLLSRKDKEEFKKDYLELSDKQIMEKWKCSRVDIVSTAKTLSIFGTVKRQSIGALATHRLKGHDMKDYGRK